MTHEEFTILEVTFTEACDALTLLEKHLVPLVEKFPGLFSKNLKEMSAGEKLKATSGIIAFYKQIKELE